MGKRKRNCPAALFIQMFNDLKYDLEFFRLAELVYLKKEPSFRIRDGVYEIKQLFFIKMFNDLKYDLEFF